MTRDVDRLFTSHLCSYKYPLPYRLQVAHKKQLEENVKAIRDETSCQGGAHVVFRRVLGDPHAPFGSRVIEFSSGKIFTKYIWKPGIDRFYIEKACQDIINILGRESGLLAIEGKRVADGGAWRKIKRASNPIKQKVASGYLTGLVLSACFNLGDMHEENVIQGKDGIYLIDTEFFAGPASGSRKIKPTSDKNRRIVDRVELSCFLPELGKLISDGIDAEYLQEQLKIIIYRAREVWPELLGIRELVTGRHSRVIYRGSGEFDRLMPYAMSSEYSGTVIKEMINNITPMFDIDQAFKDLKAGCIPVHLEEIPMATDTYNGAIYPDADFEKIMNTILFVGREKVHIEKGSDINHVLFESRMVSSYGASYFPMSVNTYSTLLPWDHAGFCYGLGGIVLLHAAEDRYNSPHIVKESSEVVNTHAERLREEVPSQGINIGIGGELLLGWGLHKLDNLSERILKSMEERLEYIKSANGSDIDLATGSAGNLVGLVRANDFMPNRVKDIKLWAQGYVERLHDWYTQRKRLGLDVKNGIPTGFAHGLAGVAFALSESKKLGIFSPLLSAMVNDLQSYFTKEYKNARKIGSFCNNLAGVKSTIRYVSGDDSSWETSESFDIQPLNLNGIRRGNGTSINIDQELQSGCCGAMAYHLGRIRPMKNFNHNRPDDCTAPYGYYGNIGIEYVKLSRVVELNDPLWGRVIKN